ncbi:metallochaperone AztD [Marinomonas algicola]|uniref:metallochaperone AztD n=1 Tax=Marinomonas algicola TaxID=2773454 RepID=UPI00174B73A4|nr:metallochaperone AztD [Marinomonas algicola]
MIKHLRNASLLTLGLMSSVIANAHDDKNDESVTLYRVFVGDHKAPLITAFDLKEPSQRWTFETAGQAKLYSVADHGVVAAVQSDADQVDFIASGVTLHDHGGHADIKTSDPKAITERLKGKRPFHLLEHNGYVSINMDKGGYAVALDAHKLSKGVMEKQRIEQNHAHHGVVVPLKDTWLSSVAADHAEEGKAPPRIGIRSVNVDGSAAGELATCTNLHGESFSGNYLALGCKEGVLTVNTSQSDLQYIMHSYPEHFPKGEMTGHLIGANSFQTFLGSYGAKGMVVIDPTEKPTMQLVELPFRRVDYTLDPIKIYNSYVLTEDGQLHQINLLNAEIENSARVIQPYSMDGHWNDPRPRLAMAGNEILITDPKAGLVHRINSEDLSLIDSIKIEGIPYNITVIGGSGLTH